MRRWLPWTILGVVLLALVVAATQVPPAGPYAFLRGRKAVAEETQTTAPHKRVLVYSFQGSFERECRLAQKETAAQGANDFFSSSDIGIFGSETRGSKLLVIYKDYKALGREAQALARNRQIAGPMRRMGQQGWVTIVVIGADPPSWFESVQAWVGM